MQSRYLVLALIALAPGVFAQVPPRAGSQIQQIPQSPALERTAPELRVQPGTAPAVPAAAADEVKFAVTRLRVSGAAALPESDLIAQSGFGAGGQFTLTQLRAMAGRIADYYHRRGYFVAQAYLPAQEITDGTVYITVVEGRYGQLKLDNTSRVNDGLANRLLNDNVRAGDPVTAAPLERSLLLLSDLPGVKVKATLSPGATVGTSDLAVEVKPGQFITGSVDADNGGNRYTGQNRLGATVNFNQLFGIGDSFTLRGMTSADDLDYGRAAYQFQVGAFRLGASYAYMQYGLGEEFADLKADGTAKVASGYASYPLLRTRATNLYLQGGYDQREFHDEAGIVDTASDKDANVWMLNANGDHADQLGGGGYTRWSLTWSSGDLDIKTAEVLTIDAATARTNGRYDKAALTVTRLQYLTSSVSLYGSFNGQVASKNLDISEKMGLGGPYAVRAYPEGEAYGDQGYVATIEGRWSLPAFSERMPGTLSLVGFVDYRRGHPAQGSVGTRRQPAKPRCRGPGDQLGGGEQLHGEALLRPQAG